MDQSELTIPSPRDLSWGYPPFPDWLMDFRPTQWEGAQQAAELFEAGYQVVFAEMPTGVGKTAAAEVVRRQRNTRAVYLVGTKQLQKQIEDRFDYAAVLWGRQNYPVRNSPKRFPEINASLCDKDEDHLCDVCMGEFEGNKGCSFCCPYVAECPYEIAKATALRADLAVANYRYWLTEANHVGSFGERMNKTTGMTVKRPFIVADEADVIEDELMGFVELHISPRRRKQFDIPQPRLKTVESAWLEWPMVALQRLRAALPRYPKQTTDIRRLQDRQWILRMIGQVEQLGRSLPNGGWVYDDQGGESIVFRPVRVDQVAGRYLWRHGERWMLMSATICAPEIMAADLGLEDGQWASFSLGSPFDPKRRPIYIIPRANMRQKTKSVEWPKMVAALEELLDTYEDERVLVPTVSYELKRYLMEELDRRHQSRLVTYDAAVHRMDALSRFRKQKAAVMLAPAMDRGVDLAGDDCRCIAIVKCPWPNRGDKQVSARMYSRGGQDWYTVRTIRRLVQTTGRGMRSADDHCDSFILDAGFLPLWNKYGRWFPRWWKEAIDWTRGGRDALKVKGNGARVAGGS